MIELLDEGAELRGRAKTRPRFFASLRGAASPAASCGDSPRIIGRGSRIVVLPKQQHGAVAAAPALFGREVLAFLAAGDPLRQEN